MRKRIEWEWEKLDDHTFRAKVIGGWLVSTEPFTPSTNKQAPTNSAVFIPDRDHEWHILEPVSEETAQKSSNNSADFDPKIKVQ